MHHTVFTFIAASASAAVAFGACEEQEPAPSTPSATARQVPQASAPEEEPAAEAAEAAAQPGAVHAGDPHAGLRRGDPHAGVRGVDPHAGMQVRGATGDRAPVEGPFSALGVTITPPEGWVAEAPKNSMRRAQYRIPKAGDDAVDGEVTVVIAGGDAASNIARWRGQFEGSPEAERSTREALGRTVTLVEIAGTFMYKERPMAPGPGDPRPDHIMRAVIIPSEDGAQSIFIKGWGPEATMEASAEDWGAVVDGLEAAE